MANLPRAVLGPMLLALWLPVQAGIPATPVMTLYQFNGPTEMPYHAIEGFTASGPGAPAGTLMQGTSVIPCLVLRNGRPLTDSSGTPYVGFEIVVDPRQADRAATAQFRDAVAARRALRVAHHHCGDQVRHVINVRQLYALDKAPFFEPPPAGGSPPPAAGGTALDRIVRDFHASPQCAAVNQRLTGRRGALARAWDDFIRAQTGTLGDGTTLARAKHLDYALRTALYEGHLGRGCNAYGACERNIVVLSIRNRAVGQCLKRQGCNFPGDFQGVSSMVSQYNIWDEYLTQISGLTACYLRPDLADRDYYAKIQAMYTQTVGDAERILYGAPADLQRVFPHNTPSDLNALRHYYHAPAMAKCFPAQSRVEYMSGAVARLDDRFALIANTRIQVGESVDGGYRFQEFRFDEEPEGDRIRIEDNYPGFIVDGRKVSLRAPAQCPPYGIPSGCPMPAPPGRHRTVPSWLAAGKPLEIRCAIEARGEDCRAAPASTAVSVGGVCDREMRPVAGVD